MWLAGGDIPQPHRLVATYGCQHLTVGAERHFSHEAGVAREWTPGFAVPADVDVVVNATSIGLHPQRDAMLDLDPAAFPVGMATRTLFTKAEIVLWRQGADTFHVEVWRSFAPYLHGLLAEAAREYVKG